jgi:hypothetical protein
MKRCILIKIAAMSILLITALMASHFLIYKALVVPRLPYLTSVPLLWWFGVYAPVLAVFITFGLGLKTWRQLTIFAIIAGLIWQLFFYLSAIWNEPGYLKADESAIFNWTIGLAATIIISAILFLTGMLVTKAVTRRVKFS